MRHHTHDVIIIGGGMVGAMLAASFGQRGLQTALVEMQEPAPFSPDDPPDLRVSAISIASQRMLEAVGAWPAVEDMRLCPYRRMLVWDGEGRGETLFDSGDIYEPVLGNIVENRVTQLALLSVVKSLDSVDWLCPHRITALSTDTDRASVTLDNGQVLSAALIVGADGARSQVRDLAGIQVERQPYGQHALVATVSTELPQQDITWQRFVPDGPQAFLPLPGHQASMVWYHNEDNVARLKALPEAAFIAEMQATFPQRLGAITQVIERGSFPLIKSHAASYTGQRLVLVGDAAHTIHPLAGQGVNLGFMDAGELVDQVLHAHRIGRDIGSARVLRAYERARRGYNRIMIGTMDVFHHGFADQKLPVKLLRNAALDVANRVKPLKHFAMRYAMGLAGDLPSLARGQLPDGP
ncbi:UbiH/UbiF/VisC/COQ6 family ubiquinone biosynthesis hydroxylase [Granulosicoccaceae sp. 1_MG-2023]|nr:UbiH/UbiF/VisC/COQ6 family ubiquinone biosynthesis hydroxylase [Granulosicoccaceae sp. 1_MG-2023]